MEVLRRIYNANIQEFEIYQGKQDRFDDFLMKYMDDNIEYWETSTIFDEKELKILKNLLHRINLFIKISELHAINYTEIINKFKDVVIDVSDACFIQIDGLELISQAKHHWTYSAIIDFLVDCHLKRNLTDFDEPIVYDFDVDGGMMSIDDVASEADLALKVIDQYNKHKKIRVNFLLGYLFHYYITFSAVDEDTGCIGTYQAALAERRSLCIIGLFRDVDADKILSILNQRGRRRNE